LLIAPCIAAAVASAAPQQASRIVDRTVLCKTSGEGFPDPLRFLNVHATPRLGYGSPNASVGNGPSGVAQGVNASVRTGPPFAPDPGTGAAVLSRVSCGRTSMKIPLSSKGLRGGPTTLGDRSKCEVPATIVIRLRAVFRNPVTFSPSKDARYLNHAEGRIRTGAIMVTTKSRAPIALVSVDDATGKASIWVSPTRCRAAD
jgi:hypothetical protein